jgi:hypothetical protein
VAAVGDVSPNKVAIANIHDDIVFARTLLAFDDLREILQTAKKRKEQGTV